MPDRTDVLAVVGVDPGARWSAAVLRAGDAALWGWTVGPLDQDGRPVAIADPDDLDAVSRYADRVAEHVDRTIQRAESSGYTRVRIAIEEVRTPIGWQHGRRTRISLADWLTPRCVAMAIRGAWPDARWVPAARHGQRDRLRYPIELQRSRPPSWPPNEARRGERDHERAAYDIAGVGAGLP